MISYIKKLFKSTDYKSVNNKIKGPLKLNPNNYMELLNLFKNSNENEIKINLKRFTKIEKQIEEIFWFVPKIIFDLTFPEVKVMESDKYTVLDKNKNARAFSFTNNEVYQELKYWIKLYEFHIPKSLVGDILSYSSEFEMLQHNLSMGLKTNNSVVVSLYES